jgi:hypothetical protein
MHTGLGHREIGDVKLREKLTVRVGRPGHAVAFVSPSGVSTSQWGGGLVGAMAPGGLATDLLVAVGAGEILGRSRAKASDMPPRMVLAVTEHDVHLYATRMFIALGDHVATVPYGAVSDVRVSGRATVVLATLVLGDGTDVRLEGDRGFGNKAREVFEYLRARAAAVPLGTAPPPAAKPESSVASALEGVTGLFTRAAAAVSEQVQAARAASTSATAAVAKDITGELERLADLRDRGVLSEAEFGLAKARVLDGN